MLLKNKKCIVSGAASGIGRQIALTYAKEGARVAVLDIQIERLKDLAEEVKGKAFAVDLRSVAGIESAFAQAVAYLGGVDVLVNCAGLANRTPIEHITEGEWDLVSDVNLKGVFFSSQMAYRQMLAQQSGRIINLSSTRGYRADGRHVIYDSTKSGVHAMTRAFAVAGGPNGITCNCISPAYTLTPMTTHNLDTPGWLERITRHIPIGRLIEMQEVADAALFLASDLAASINGIDIPVDGGWLAGED